MKHLQEIKLFIIDVDGTMTDGGIYYDDNGNEIKKFCTKDAAGYFTAHQVNIKLMALTGRECAATLKRLKEMKFDYIYQDVIDKKKFILEFAKKTEIKMENVGFIGDDLNDLSTMVISGFSGCPADACEEVKEKSNYISPVKGGYGAVRDIISYYLKERNQWEAAYKAVYGIGEEYD